MEHNEKMELYRDKIIGGCRYIAEQYALKEIDPSKCDSYEKRKYTLEREYGVDSAEWFKICNENGSELMQDLINRGDLGAGMSFLANCAKGYDNENVATDIFMSHDGEITMYDFLRRATGDQSITKESFDNAAKDKFDELNKLDENVKSSLKYIAEQRALFKTNPELCDSYEAQKAHIEAMCGVTAEKWPSMIDHQKPARLDEMIRDGDRNAGLSIVGNYILGPVNANLVSEMLVDSDNKTSVYEYLRVVNDDPSITKARVEAYVAKGVDLIKGNQAPDKSASDDVVLTRSNPVLLGGAGENNMVSYADSHASNDKMANYSKLSAEAAKIGNDESEIPEADEIDIID